MKALYCLFIFYIFVLNIYSATFVGSKYVYLPSATNDLNMGGFGIKNIRYINVTDVYTKSIYIDNQLNVQGSIDFNSDVDMHNKRIINVGYPISNNHVATKEYVDKIPVVRGALSPRDYAYHLNAVPILLTDIYGIGYGGYAYEYNGGMGGHCMWFLGNVYEATNIVIRIHTATIGGSNCIHGVVNFGIRETTNTWHRERYFPGPLEYTTNPPTYSRIVRDYIWRGEVISNSKVMIRFNVHGFTNALGQSVTGVVYGITWEAYK